MKCPECNGTGKEICDNPDHGFIDAMAGTDIQRLGCPCCGHDPEHIIKNSACDMCHGTGYTQQGVCDECSSQEEGRHYCMLHEKVVKNMDISTCDDFTPREDTE